MSPRQQKKKTQTKVDALLARARTLFAVETAEAFKLAEEALYLAESLDDQLRIAEAHERMAMCLDRFGRYDELLEHGSTAIRIWEEQEQEHREPQLLGLMAVALRRQGSLERGLELIARALEILDRHDNPFERAMTLNRKGILLDSVARRVEAMDALMEALAIWERVEDAGWPKAMTYSNLATVLYGLGELERSSDYFLRSIELYRVIGNSMGTAVALRNVAEIHVQLKRPEQALVYVHEALQLFQALDATGWEAMAQLTRGNAFRDLGRAAESVACYLRSLEVARRTADIDLMLGLFPNLVSYYESIGEIDQAIAYCLESLATVEERRDLDQMIELHERAAALLEKRERYREALEHVRRWAALKQEVLDVEKQRAVVEMQTKYETKVLERETEIQRLRIEQLRREVEQRDKELAVRAMQLVERNEYLVRMEREILSASGSTETARVIGRLRAELKPEADWASFMGRFRQVHPEFEMRMAERFPGLTPAELRVCVLTKVGLSTKEISSMLHTSVRTIENQRASIRRKLEMPTASSFAMVLAGL